MARKFTPSSLKKAWPEYKTSHGISDTEIKRLGSFANSLQEADHFYSNRIFWRDSSESPASKGARAARYE